MAASDESMADATASELLGERLVEGVRVKFEETTSDSFPGKVPRCSNCGDKAWSRVDADATVGDYRFWRGFPTCGSCSGAVAKTLADEMGEMFRATLGDREVILEGVPVKFSAGELAPVAVGSPLSRCGVCSGYASAKLEARVVGMDSMRLEHLHCVPCYQNALTRVLNAARARLDKGATAGPIASKPCAATSSSPPAPAANPLGEGVVLIEGVRVQFDLVRGFCIPGNVPRCEQCHGKARARVDATAKVGGEAVMQTAPCCGEFCAQGVMKRIIDRFGLRARIRLAKTHEGVESASGGVESESTLAILPKPREVWVKFDPPVGSTAWMTENVDALKGSLEQTRAELAEARAAVTKLREDVDAMQTKRDDAAEREAQAQRETECARTQPELLFTTTHERRVRMLETYAVEMFRREIEDALSRHPTLADAMRYNGILSVVSRAEELRRWKVPSPPVHILGDPVHGVSQTQDGVKFFLAVDFAPWPMEQVLNTMAWRSMRENVRYEKFAPGLLERVLAYLDEAGRCKSEWPKLRIKAVVDVQAEPYARVRVDGVCKIEQ